MAVSYKQRCDAAEKAIHRFSSNLNPIKADILVFCDGVGIELFQNVKVAFERASGYFNLCETVVTKVDWPYTSSNILTSKELFSQVQAQRFVNIRSYRFNDEMVLEFDIYGRCEHRLRYCITRHLDTDAHEYMLGLLRKDLDKLAGNSKST